MLGAGLGMPYEIILRDFSKTNYSSARASLGQAYRIFRAWQQLIVDAYCQPVWAQLLEEAYYMGELPAPGFEKYIHEYTRAQWITPGWQHVDPLKEAKAQELLVNNNFMSRSEVCASLGTDWEAVALQRQRESETDEDLGIKTPEQKNAETMQPVQDGQDA